MRISVNVSLERESDGGEDSQGRLEARELWAKEWRTRLLSAGFYRATRTCELLNI